MQTDTEENAKLMQTTLTFTMVVEGYDVDLVTRLGTPLHELIAKEGAETWSIGYKVNAKAPEELKPLVLKQPAKDS